MVFPGDRYISARHARIDLTGDAVTVTDLGSSNGTFRRITGRPQSPPAIQAPHRGAAPEARELTTP